MSYDDPADRDCTRAAAAVPARAAASYDVRVVINDVLDQRLVPRVACRVRAQPRHRARPSRRARRGRDRQPAHAQRRQPRRRRRAEGRPLRAVVRLLQHRGHHVRRHQRLPPGPRPRVARDHPSRRAAAARVRGGDRPAPVRRAAQGVRRRVHRDGLAWARHRLVRRVADRRDRGDGRAAGRAASCTAGSSTRSRTPSRVPPRSARSRSSTRSASSIRTSPPSAATSTTSSPPPTPGACSPPRSSGCRPSASTNRDRRHSNTPL